METLKQKAYSGVWLFECVAEMIVFKLVIWQPTALGLETALESSDTEGWGMASSRTPRQTGERPERRAAPSPLPRTATRQPETGPWSAPAWQWREGAGGCCNGSLHSLAYLTAVSIRGCTTSDCFKSTFMLWKSSWRRLIPDYVINKTEGEGNNLQQTTICISRTYCINQKII